MTNAPDPAEALAAIQASRRAVHDRVASGGWRYDISYAALVAVMIGGQALDNPFNVTASTLGVFGLMLIFQAEKRRTGLRVTGVSPRHARWVAIAMGLIFAAVIIGLALAVRTWAETSPLVIGAAAAGLGFVVALIGSRVWRRVYRAEMGGSK